jgi:hypothetical protein
VLPFLWPGRRYDQHLAFFSSLDAHLIQGRSAFGWRRCGATSQAPGSGDPEISARLTDHVGSSKPGRWWWRGRACRPWSQQSGPQPWLASPYAPANGAQWPASLRGGPYDVHHRREAPTVCRASSHSAANSRQQRGVPAAMHRAQWLWCFSHAPPRKVVQPAQSHQ